MYHPTLGRFLQRDPIGNPDGLNAYAAYHVMGEGMDPSGEVMVSGTSRMTPDPSDPNAPAVWREPDGTQTIGTNSNPGVPRIKIETVFGPAVGNCGEVEWQTNFTLGRPSLQGGYFVQHVRMLRMVHECEYPFMLTEVLHFEYWEGWRVDPGDTYETDVVNGLWNFTDNYFNSDMGDCTWGVWVINATLVFYEGLNALPASFVPGGVNPAGALPATNIDPNLAGGFGFLEHSIVVKWDCCQGESPTEILTYTPKG